MLSLFRQNLFINSLLLLPYTIIVRIHSLIYPKAYASSELEGWFNCSVFETLSGLPRLQAVLAILIIFLQAVSLNFILNKNRLSLRPNLFPGVFYILFVSISREYLSLNPILFGNIFIIIVLVNLFKTYRIAQCSGAIFNIGFFVAMASVFYFPYIAYLIPCFIGLMMLRSFRLKERIQYLIGALTFLYLLFAMFFYFDLSSDFFAQYFQSNLPLPSIASSQITIYIPIAIFAIGILAAVINYYSIRKKKSIQSQKKIDILYWALIFSPFMIIFWNVLNIYSLLVLAIPLSIIVGMLIYRIKNQLVVELLHFAGLVAMIAFHFGLFL